MKALVARFSAAPSVKGMRWGTKRRDLFAVLPLVAWYAFSILALANTIHAQLKAFAFGAADYTAVMAILAKLAILLFSVVVIGFLFLRLPPRSAAHGILPRLAAIFGTYLSVGFPLLLQPANLPTAMLAFSTLLILGGMAFAIHAILHLGRSFSVMAEARRLVTTGPYAWIRHPLYLGEEIAIVGVMLQYASPAAIAILVCQVACQLYRMECEEQVLSTTFEEYRAYRARTARLLPGVY